MNIKKSISIITILMFSFLFCITCTRNVNLAIAEESEECVGEECTVDGEEANRGSDFYQYDTQTTAWGGLLEQWQYGPDAGYGETGQGYTYYDPMTGQSVSMQTTGMGMGQLALPMYGGMNSQLAQQSYGPFAYGNDPNPQTLPGQDTMTSMAGNAFGQGYQYAAAQPNVNAILSQSLMSNPSTMGLGLAVAAQSGAFSGYGIGGTSYGLGGIGLGSAGLGGIGLGTSLGGYGLGSYGLGGVGYGGSPYGTVIGGSAYGASPYAASAYGANPYAASAYGASAYQQPYYGSSYGSGYQQPYYGSSYGSSYQQPYYGNSYGSSYSSPYYY